MEDSCHYISARGFTRICSLNTNKNVVSSYLSYDELLSKVKDGDSVYVWSGKLHEFIDQCIPSLRKKITLVSGDSDETVHTIHQYRIILECPYIVRWFPQNCMITHEKVTHIPIGLVYHAYYDAKDKSNPWSEKIKTPLEQEYDIQQLLPSRPFWKRKAKCYSTFHFYLDRGDRHEAFTSIPRNLIDYEPIPVDRLVSYKHQMEYAFVVSPFGGGPDCHRTWEALLLGCIAIVKLSGMDPLFDDLPVLLVDRWSDVTQELLDSTIETFKGRSFAYEKLTLAYWKEKINSSA